MCGDAQSHSSPSLHQECRLTVTCAEEKRCLRTLLYLSCLGLQRPWVIRSAIPDYDRSVDIPSLRFQEGFPPQTLAKMFVSTIATGRCFGFFLENPNSPPQIITGFHGCSFSVEGPFVAGFVSSSFGTWMPGVVIVEVTTVRSVRRPDTELWEASHLPDSFPLQPLLSWFSDTLGSAHPGCPRSLSFPPFSSPPRSLLFTPSFQFLSFSLSPGLRCFQELPVSPE